MAPGVIDPAWRTDEDPALLTFEQLVYAAVSVGAVAFGLHTAIFSIYAYHAAKAKKFPALQLIYTVVLFLLAGVTIGCNLSHNQMTWIDNRAYPGGPGAFILEQQGQFVNTIGNSAGLILAFMVDSLLIHRCYIVWSSKYYVVVLPILMLIASTVMAILQTIAASQPQSALWNERAVVYGLPYFVLNMTTNMLVTAIIVARLLVARRQVRKSMGGDYGKHYTSIAAMLVESAAPPALVSIILIALYSRGVPAQVLFYPLLPQVQAIAPQLIFIRVLRGRGWNKNTLTTGQDNSTSPPMRFGSNPSGTVFTTGSGSNSVKNVGSPWGDKGASSTHIARSGSY